MHTSRRHQIREKPMQKNQIRAACVLLCCAWLSAGAEEATTPAIAGVVDSGTAIQLVKDGIEAVEGPIPEADGGLLFTNNRLGRILRAAPDGSVSVWYEGKGTPNALTRTRQGEIAATLHETLAIGVLKPGEAPRVLVGAYDGKPFNRPNDLVADRRGNIYFTDTVSITATTPGLIPSAVYQLREDGTLTRITTEIARPNGVALSPDERTLFVANTAGDWIQAFELSRKGVVGKRRDFAKLAMPVPQNGVAPGSGADGIAVDAKGRLFVATTLGVQVFSAKGAALGIIAMPRIAQNLAFSGPGRKSLYVVGRGAVYRIDTKTRGPDRAAK
jgi:gluconolactonase